MPKLNECAIGVLFIVAACSDGGPCKDLDHDACASNAACEPYGCPDCDGAMTFAGCAAKGELVQFDCPGIACADCTSLPESSCLPSAGCMPLTCDHCGTTTFAGCARAGTKPAPICPDAPCPQACADLTTEASCDARTDCHPSYLDPGTCGCFAAGCCTMFDHCADGATANCTGPAVCAISQPNCEGPYVVAYSSASCYEGCVKSTDCAP